MKFENLNHTQRKAIFNMMHSQCKGIDWIEAAFICAWSSFEYELWDYDGATFVREHEGNFWEVAAFIHDWMNVTGYVGKKVDLYFIKIMITLNYGENIIFERCKWMQWTWLNILNHKWIKRDFIANDIPDYLK